MSLFNVLQLLFDAFILFGILFLFNYSVSQTRKKEDDLEIVKSAQAQEIREQLQELLLTLKQLGNEVSDNIQKEVREAEGKTDSLQKLLRKVQKELDEREKFQVDGIKPVNSVKGPTPKKRKIESEKAILPSDEPNLEENTETGMFGLSSEIVREVYRLVDEDNDIKTICEMTLLSRAEIQLILNLRGNRFTTPN